jgi:selenocysteine-specific elongation factor
LEPNAKRIKKATELDLKMIRDLSSSDPLSRASASAYLANDLSWTPAAWSRTAGIVNTTEVYQQLKEAGLLIEIKVSLTRNVIIHRDRFHGLADRVLKTLERLHKMAPLRFNHPRTVLENEFSYLEQSELLDLVIDELKHQKKVNANINSIGLVGYGPKLSKGQKLLLEELVATVKSAGLKTPSVDDLVKSAKKNKESVAELLEMAGENGDLTRVSDDLYFHADVIAETRQRLAEEIQKANGLTMSEIRQILDTSRKYAIPLCEYFDNVGFTVRDGDKRLLGTSH